MPFDEVRFRADHGDAAYEKWKDVLSYRQNADGTRYVCQF
jgi:hypothetical protein